MLYELSKDEIAVIEAFRAIECPPANIVLWWIAGLRESSEKIKSVSKHQYKYDQQRMKILRDVFNKNK